MRGLGLGALGLQDRALSLVPRLITVGNETFYGKGDWFVYLGPWGSDGLTPGVDFDHSATFRASEFPNGLTVNWDFPNQAPPSGGVFGYDFLAYGNYNNSSNGRPVSAVQISALTSAFMTFDWSYAGSDNFGLLAEAYLNSAADAAPGTRVVAVDWFLHSNTPIDGTYIGSFTDGFGVSWGVKYATGAATPGAYIRIYPLDGEDVLTGGLDWKFAIDYAVSQGLATSDLYLTGVAFGSEVASGGGVGSWTPNSITMGFNNATPDGYGTPEVIDESGGNLWGPIGYWANNAAWNVNGDQIDGTATAFQLTTNTSHDVIPAGDYLMSFVVTGTGALRFNFKNSGGSTIITKGNYAAGTYTDVAVTLTQDCYSTQLQAGPAPGFTGSISTPTLVAA